MNISLISSDCIRAEHARLMLCVSAQNRTI